jgi:hypothetical protein
VYSSGVGVHGPARGKAVAASDPVQRDVQRLPKVPESLAPCDGAVVAGEERGLESAGDGFDVPA